MAINTDFPVINLSEEDLELPLSGRVSHILNLAQRKTSEFSLKYVQQDPETLHDDQTSAALTQQFWIGRSRWLPAFANNSCHPGNLPARVLFKPTLTKHLYVLDNGTSDIHYGRQVPYLRSHGPRLPGPSTGSVIPCRLPPPSPL